MLRAPDLAYLAGVVEADGTKYPRKSEVVDALQSAWKAARTVNTSTITMPVMTDYALAEAQRKGEKGG